MPHGQRAVPVGERRYNAAMISGDVLAEMRARLTAALAPPRRRYRPLSVERRAAGWLDDTRAAAPRTL